MQWRERNVQKSVMHVQSCCFANLSLLLFFAVLDDVTVVVKNSLLRTRKYNFCFGIRWIYWFERLSCVNSFWVIKGRRQVTYQLLDSVEEDKVYHGIKIRMILNIALFESLAERPAWRNLQNFTFALSLRPPRVALRKERSTACVLPLSFLRISSLEISVKSSHP